MSEATIRERLSDFYSPEEVGTWLHAPHPLLGGGRAIDLIAEGRGDEVWAVINNLEALAYV